jgi:hypothetical protein
LVEELALEADVEQVKAAVLAADGQRVCSDRTMCSAK